MQDNNSSTEFYTDCVMQCIKDHVPGRTNSLTLSICPDTVDDPEYCEAEIDATAVKRTVLQRHHRYITRISVAHHAASGRLRTVITF
jgi:hypothetical protein